MDSRAGRCLSAGGVVGSAGAAFRLSLYGLRRGEVLGLRWSDIDLDAKTLTVRLTRVPVVGIGVVEGPPKTERGRRTLPLDEALVAALRSLKARQAQERDCVLAGSTGPLVRTVVASTWSSTRPESRIYRSGTSTRSTTGSKRPGFRSTGSTTHGTPVSR